MKEQLHILKTATNELNVNEPAGKNAKAIELLQRQGQNLVDEIP